MKNIEPNSAIDLEVGSPSNMSTDIGGASRPISLNDLNLDRQMKEKPALSPSNVLVSTTEQQEISIKKLQDQLVLSNGNGKITTATSDGMQIADMTKSNLKLDAFAVEIPVKASKAVKSSNELPEIPKELLVEDSLPEELAAGIAEARLKAQKKFNFTRMFLLLNIAGNTLGALTLAGVIPPFVLLIIVVGALFLASSVLLFQMRTSADKKAKVLLFAHFVCLIFYIIFGILTLKGVVNSLWIGVIPGAVLTIVEPCIGSIREGNLFVKWVLWIQLFLIVLRADVFNFQWPLALFLLNSLAFVCFLVFVLTAVLWVTTLFGGHYFGIAGRLAVIGSGWSLLLVGSTVTWGIMIFALEGVIFTTLGGCWAVFVAGAGYSLLLVLTSVVFNGGLMSFLKENAFRETRCFEKIEEYERRTEFEVKKGNGVSLLKLSSTYYCAAENGMPAMRQPSSLQVQHRQSSSICRLLTNVELPNLELLQKPCLNLAENTKTDKANNKENVNTDNCLVLVDDIKDLSEISKEKGQELQEIKEYKEDIEEDEDSNKCMICFEKEPNMVITECGHGGMCCWCAVTGWKKNDKCHLCRKQIRSIQRVKYDEEDNTYKVVDKIVRTYGKRTIAL